MSEQTAEDFALTFMRSSDVFQASFLNECVRISEAGGHPIEHHVEDICRTGLINEGWKFMKAMGSFEDE